MIQTGQRKGRPNTLHFQELSSFQEKEFMRYQMIKKQRKRNLKSQMLRWWTSAGK